MEKRIEEIETKIASLLQHIKEGNQAISDGFKKVSSNFEITTARLHQIEAELKIINAKIEKLDGNTSDGFGQVEVKLDDLKTEIQKIGSVTGYDDILNNLKIVRGGKN